MGLGVYEVDVLVLTPTTRRVVAGSPEEARVRALRGEGGEVPGVVYSDGEVVDVRYLESFGDRLAEAVRLMQDDDQEGLAALLSRDVDERAAAAAARVRGG
jgi:hypothetical protein